METFITPQRCPFVVLVEIHEVGLGAFLSGLKVECCTIINSLYVQSPPRQLWDKARSLTCSHCSSSPILVSFALAPKMAFSSPLLSPYEYVYLSCAGIPFPALHHHQHIYATTCYVIQKPTRRWTGLVRVQNAPLQLKAQENSAAGLGRRVQLDQMLPLISMWLLLFLDHQQIVLALLQSCPAPCVSIMGVLSMVSPKPRLVALICCPGSFCKFHTA